MLTSLIKLRVSGCAKSQIDSEAGNLQMTFDLLYNL